MIHDCQDKRVTRKPDKHESKRLQADFERRVAARTAQLEAANQELRGEIAALHQIEYAGESKPNLILLDVIMPGLNGFEVCRRLKANAATQAIPVIFMTALSETVDKVAGFAAGGVDYVTKPMQCEEVLARVQAHLTIQQLQRELQRKNVALEKAATGLSEKNTDLEHANASKDRFFSIIAHDLKSPFSGLLGITRLFADEFEPYPRDKLSAMVITLHEAAENVYALLENLLKWSLSQRGQIEYEPQDIDLYDVVTTSIAVFASYAEQKEITFRNAIQPPTVVYADGRMVHTVVRNLLSNALKFTHSGGHVTIAAAHDGNMVTTSVVDSGLGIAPEHIPELFRIDAAYKRDGTANERGTGLGLILCREFVVKNGGTIWVESDVAIGSTFRFTLPSTTTPLNLKECHDVKEDQR